MGVVSRNARRLFVVIAATIGTLPPSPARAGPCPPVNPTEAIEASFEEVTDLMADWNRVLQSGRETVKARSRRKLDKLCRNAQNTAERMREKGIHMDVGLSADIREKTGYKKDILGGDPMWASIIDQKYLECFESRNVCSGVKHFPGIGGLTIDPHDALSSEVLDTEDLKYHEFKPFYAAVQANACSIMTTHTLVRTPDGRTESCMFSKGCIGILRKGMGFNRLIVTDDIFSMNAALDALLENEYDRFLPQEEGERNAWRKRDIVSRASFIMDKLCAERGGCSDQDYERTFDEVMDEEGGKRAVAAIRAGNDLILNMYPPDKIETGVHATIREAKKAIASGTLSERDIDASVTRLLAEKERMMGKSALYSGFPGAKSPSDIVRRMNIDQKIRQMIAIDGRWSGEKKAQELGLGGVYTPRRSSKLTGTNASKIPSLVMGDKEYDGYNKALGDEIMTGE